MTEIKICTVCNREKELSEFYRQQKTKEDGSLWIYYNPQCKECVKKKSLERHHENKEEANKRSKEWYQRNRERVLEYMPNYLNQPKYKQKQKEWRQENPERVKEYSDKYKEKQHKITTKQWNACKGYFDHYCAYCGITEKEAKKKQGKNLNKEHALNQGENDLSNCIPACTSCNSSKHIDDYTEWYIPDNPIYNEERKIKIETWLYDDYKNFI